MMTPSTKTKELQADASFLDAVDTPLLELHKSNILKLEVDELLDECRLDIKEASWASQVSDYMALLSNVIGKLSKAQVKKDDCPFPLRSDKVKLVEIPTDLKVIPVGSHSINCVTKKGGNANVLPTLDCAVVIPNSYWQQKDYLDHRYMDKRNVILWNIGKLLGGKKVKKHVGEVQWRNYNGNQFIPALILTPPSPEKKSSKKRKTGMLSPKFRVQLVVAMESLDWIPSPRLFPNRSNLKGGISTPYYNSILARDAFWIEANTMLSGDISDLPHFRDTMIIAKVWCLQRGFIRGHDSFDDVHLGVMILYLYRTKRASPRMLPLQVFTVLMKFIAEEWTSGKAFCMPKQGKNEAITISSCLNSKLYAKQSKESPVDPINGDPSTLLMCHLQASTSSAVLLNSTMLGNYLGTLSPVFCKSVTQQAKKTISCLSSAKCFSALFLTNARFWSCMDAYFHVPLKDICWKGTNLWGNRLHDLGEVECLSRDLVSILEKALGDRVSEIRVLTNGNGHGASGNDVDQIPTYDIGSTISTSAKDAFSTPTGMGIIVCGLKLNCEHCHRAVDRGPPANDSDGVESFLDLWRSAAELRRFKDGAIVHAAVWNLPDSNACVGFEGDERTQGGIVERIVQHIVGQHFLRDSKEAPRFILREMLAAVEGVRSSTSDPIETLLTNSTLAHRRALTAFEALAEFLRINSEQPASLQAGQSSKLCLPLQIDAVEPLSPALRYSSVFPPIPHVLLGFDGKRASNVAGEIAGDPIQIQVRFGKSSKWPTDLTAMGAAKTAMLVQLADGIETMKRTGACSGFAGPMVVTATDLTFGYLGYAWRVLVRADPELHLLRGLRKPSTGAVCLLDILTKKNVTSSSHHATIHAVHTLHPSAGHVVRLFSQWLASHLLSGLIPFEAVELLVAHVYSDKGSPYEAPATVAAGFLRVLWLLATFDWVRHPLIVDPRGHLTDDDYARARACFQVDRGSDYSSGPAMYIIAQYDCRDLAKDESNDGEKINEVNNADNTKSCRPSFTKTTPERVTLFRAVSLAKRSHDHLLCCLSGSFDDKWTSIFRESQSSLKSFSVLLRVDKDFIVDTNFSSTDDMEIFSKNNGGQLESIFTRSMKNRNSGLKALRRKMYRNLSNRDQDIPILDWNPVDKAIKVLSQKMSDHALFFYNEYSPEVIAVLFRPSTFEPSLFTAMQSESVRPAQRSGWKHDSLMTINVLDLLRELRQVTKDIITTAKVLDERSYIRQVQDCKPNTSKRKPEELSEVSDDGDDSA